MPVFTIETPGGKRLTIEAADEGQAMSGAQQWHAEQTKAAQPAGIEATFTDVPKEIVTAFNESLGALKSGIMDPVARRTERMKEPQSFFGGMAGGLKDFGADILDTGKAIASIPGMLGAPITGAARSLLGHPLQAVDELLRAGATMFNGEENTPPALTYEQAKGMVDTAMMALAPRSANPAGMRALPKPVPTTEAIDTAAKAGFDNARNSGVRVPSSDVSRLATTVRSELQADGVRDYLAPKTYAVLKELETPPPAGAFADVGDLHGIRRALGQVASSPDGTERMAATRALKKLDGMLTNVSPELKEAIGNYAAAKRSDTITAKLDRADLNAGSANSGQNLDNAIRQQIKTILNNPKARRGYNAEELAQMEKIVRGTSAGNLLRGAGNLMGGGGGLGAVISAGAGGFAAGPAGLAAPVAGYGIKKLGNALTSRQVGKLDNMVRSRSPLAQSFPTPTASQPSPLLAALMSGQITLPQLLNMGMPQLMGAIPVRADDEQRK